MKYRAPGINEREAAVLGLLYERPLYGYTIEKIIEERGMRHWTDIGFSSIYYVLKRLEQRDLIASSSEQEGTGPSRNVYTITAAGRSRMKETVRLFLSRYTKMITPFNLGIANAALLSRQDLIGCLDKRLIMIDETVLHIESMRESKIAEARPYYVIALFDRSLAHLRTERDWVAGFIRDLQDRNETAGLAKEREPGTEQKVYRNRRI
jgi:DNA-binding PadR family transcriptional regulator